MKKIFSLGFFVILLLNSVSGFSETDLVSIQASSRRIKITGFSRARTNMVLSSEVAGKVTNVYADIGDAIPDKAKFACLDDTFVDIDIKSAQNDIEQHNVDIRYFSKQVSRYKKLVDQNSASISLLDDFERQLDNSRSQKQKQTLRKKRLAELKRRHCIEATAGWLVVERYIEPGQWIKSGDEVAKISDYSKLLVPFALSMQQLEVLKNQKQQLHVQLSDYGITVPAAIERISPAFDEQSHKIRVDLRIQEQLPEFRGGMRVELSLKVPDEMGTWEISEKALDERFEEYWLQRKNGKRIRVTLLGYTGEGTARISSTEISIGDQFKLLHN